MFSSLLKTIIRRAFRQKGYTLINLFGLAAGLAACILILIWVQDELAFDRFHTHIDRLHRITIEDHSSGQVRQVAVTPAPLAAALKEEIPDLERVTRIGNLRTSVRRGEALFNESVLLADPDFLQMFSFPLLRGDRETALRDPHSLLLTQSAAQKYFGSEDPLGQVLTADGDTDFQVTGILADPPSYSTLQFEMVAPFELLADREVLDFWGAWRYYTFVQLREDARAEVVEPKIASILQDHDATSQGILQMQPLADLHLRSNLLYDDPSRGDIRYVWIFASLGLIILLVACINFMNLATAQSGKRASEIGVRKVIGASRRLIFRQSFVESLLLTFVALLIAVGGVELLLPTFETLTGKQLDGGFFSRPSLVAGILLVTLLTGIISGLYPALLLARLQPASIIKKVKGSSSTSSTARRILVVLQFCITIFLLIGTLVTSGQLRYLQHKKLGFDQDQVLYLRFQGDLIDRYPALKQELLASPSVEQVSASFQLPTNIGSSPGEMDWEGRAEGHRVLINAGLVDYDYFETLKMELVEGRTFSPDYPADLDGAYILNEEAVRQMGIENPIGKWFSFWDMPGPIVGVVKDFHSTSLHHKINPIVLKLDQYWLNYILIRIQPDHLDQSLAAIEETWNRFNPDYPFQYRFLDESITAQYQAEGRMTSLFQVFTLLAMGIAALGLLGLSSYVAQRRTREIGIRKVLGATAGNIVKLMTAEFVTLVFIANIVSWPAAWLVMNGWLQHFAYRIDLEIGYFLCAGIAALAVALLTVSVQAVKAAWSDPVHALRYE